MDSQYFTEEGLKKLKEELKYREETLRPEIAARIKEAKEQGDISENAEFDAAKAAQSLNEGRIEEVKSILENAVVFKAGVGEVVNIGSGITVESDRGIQHFVIVGPAESDPTSGFISNESPSGKAFLGHKKGETVEVRTPRGMVKYKIKEVK